MDIQKIIEKMHEGIILLEYTSLISGTQKVREVTTCHKYLPKKAQVFGEHWVQNVSDEKLLCYDIEFARWDDIDINTIINWQEIEGKDWKVKMALQTDLNWDGNV